MIRHVYNTEPAGFTIYGEFYDEVNNGYTAEYHDLKNGSYELSYTPGMSGDIFDYTNKKWHSQGEGDLE